MKNIIFYALVLAVLGVSFLFNTGKSADDRPHAGYEYASIRFQGGQKTCIVWPDGKVDKLSALSSLKRPDNADERMFYLTIAVNLLAKEGFEFVSVPALGNPDDIFGRRPRR